MKRKKVFSTSVMLFGVLLFIFCFHAFHSGNNYCAVSQTGCSDGFGVSQIPSTISTSRPETVTEETVYTGFYQQKSLSDVYISIKSTKKYHFSRLPLLLLTWLDTVPSKNVHIVTDGDDDVIKMATSLGYNIYQSTCPIKHVNSALACKCGDEFELYYKQVENGSSYSWYCHFDDDMYVNTRELEFQLSRLSHKDKHYIGRWSVGRDTRIKFHMRNKSDFKELKRDAYFFATGAAYCLSSSLMVDMEDYVRGRKLEKTAKSIGTPDDMAVGFVVEAVLGYNLTNVKEMNSHLNPIQSLKPDSLPKQITISYSELNQIDRRRVRRINLPKGAFSEDEDPTRFFSYHCLLYPIVPWCQQSAIPHLSQLNIQQIQQN